jgi:hypothetical protein
VAAAVKLAGLSGKLPRAHRVRWARMQHANRSQLIPETLLTGGTAEGRSGIIEQASAVEGGTDYLDLLLDVDQFLGEGRSHEKICQKQDIEASTVEYLRQHREQHGL